MNKNLVSKEVIEELFSETLLCIDNIEEQITYQINGESDEYLDRLLDEIGSVTEQIEGMSKELEMQHLNQDQAFKLRKKLKSMYHQKTIKVG